MAHDNNMIDLGQLADEPEMLRLLGPGQTNHWQSSGQRRLFNSNHFRPTAGSVPSWRACPDSWELGGVWSMQRPSPRDCRSRRFCDQRLIKGDRTSPTPSPNGPLRSLDMSVRMQVLASRMGPFAICRPILRRGHRQQSRYNFPSPLLELWRTLRKRWTSSRRRAILWEEEKSRRK
jgi:hypothetical protein